MDAFGHVNNVTFFRYLEASRMDLLFQLASEIPEEKPLSEGGVVSHQELYYVQQMVYRREPVVVETWIADIKAARLRFHHVVKDYDTIYVRGSAEMVPYDFGTHRPRRFTDRERKFFEEFRPDS